MNDVVLCERCGTPCKANPERNETARLLRHADEGYCVNCAITAFLKGTVPLGDVLQAKGANVLLIPAVQKQAARMIEVGRADALPSEIDWGVVVAQWEF
jgi:hypothetical protein